MPTWMSGRGVRSAATGLVLGLLVGLLIGGHADVLDRATAPDEVASGAPMALGPIHQALEGPVPGTDFELPVFNSTHTEVDATLLSLEGVSSPLSSDSTRGIAPGQWAVIPFSISPNCDSLGRRPVRSGTLRLLTSAGSDEASLPLPDQGKALLDYLQALCATGAAMRPGQLIGVWMVEDVYGPDTYLAGLEMVRFSPDGSVVADAQGGLDSDRVGIRGRYRLRNELLTVNVTSGYACEAGSHVTWRVSVDDNDKALLSMVWIRGTCPHGASGDVWVARRVLSSNRK